MSSENSFDAFGSFSKSVRRGARAEHFKDCHANTDLLAHAFRVFSNLTINGFLWQPCSDQNGGESLIGYVLDTRELREIPEFSSPVRFG